MDTHVRSALPISHLIRWLRNKFHRKNTYRATLNFDKRKLAVSIVVVLALTAGFSGLLLSNTFTPLIFGAAVIGAAALLAMLFQPEWMLYLALLVIFLPEGIIPQEIQSMLNRALTILALGVWAVNLILQRKKVILNTSTILMIIFILWSVLSLFWTEKLDIGFVSIQRYILRMLLFLLLISNVINNQRSLTLLMASLALSGWILFAASAVVIMVNGYEFGSRFKLFDLNENAAGILALLSLIGMIWLAIAARKMKWAFMFASYIHLFLTIGLIAISGSRGSAISLVFALLVLLLWKSTRLWGVLGFTVLLIGAIGASMLFSATINRFIAGAADTSNESLLGGREGLWQAGWALIEDHFVLGVGIGNAQYAVIPYFDRTLITYEIPAPVWEENWTSLHNPIITIWGETGVIGLMLYLSVFIYALWQFAQSYIHERQHYGNDFLPYFALIAALTAGYLPSWVKGGGSEFDYLFFLVIGLLNLPALFREKASPDLGARMVEETQT